MLRGTATAAKPIPHMKLFEVYCMQYNSPAGTSALSASHKHRVMRLAAPA